MSCSTLDTHCHLSLSFTGLLPCIVYLSRYLLLEIFVHYWVLYPKCITTSGLGSYHFARHYFGNRCFTFFSSWYLDVSVPRVPHHTLCIHVWLTRNYSSRVSSFRNLRIKAYLQLPVAYRSLSRLSSALCAKAFTCVLFVA